MRISNGRSARGGTWLCGALTVLLAACSGKTVDLGGRADKGAGGAGASAGMGGGASGFGGVSSEGGAGVSSEGGTVVSSEGGTVVSNGDVPDPTPTVTRSRKLDLLFMVDNSISMADKEQALKVTIPDLVNRLTASSLGITDLHVGVISSSLGDHGDNATCLGKDNGTLGDEELDDHGRLITTRPRGAKLGIPEVISWDSTQSTATLIQQIQDVVVATGEFGCGLESQLESIYRFLVDPVPPVSIARGPCAGGSSQQCAFPVGIDQVLLAQRAAFLRPDSAVAVVMLSDENDCSIRDERQYFYAATAPTKVLLPHGSAPCATNPNDACCYSCGGTPPAGCASDPSCTPPTRSTAKDDQLNLRCFDQKRRFGLDFLYPIERYVNAFTRTHLCAAQADLAPNAETCRDASGTPQEIFQNPLFYGADGSIRSRSLVSVLGIVGVPWQDLNADGSTASSLHYKGPSALAADATWNAIIGDPAASPPRPPTDGLMVESRVPRTGSDINGVPIPGPKTPIAANSAINGHEWWNTPNDDLMFACIYPLPEPRDCLAVEKNDPAPGCDCGDSFNASDFNPLCESPDGTYGNVQYFAKAYPGTRELSLLKALGAQGLTASVCPKNLTDVTRNDYGYRPAVDLLIDALKATVP